MSPIAEEAELLLEVIQEALTQAPPPGVTSRYIGGFFQRHRPRLIRLLARVLEEDEDEAPAPTPAHQPPDLWTPAQRTAANLKAMEILARKAPGQISAQDRIALGLYSGWGGLSIEKVKARFPEGTDTPEQRGLIHEYYTPSKVAAEVARVVAPLLRGLQSKTGRVLALEPSAGIGRFVRALSGPGFESIDWLTVEWSALSAKMLQTLRPDLEVYQGPFERWIRERGPKVNGRLRLVIANPPYGARGASISEDPDRDYREKAAYAYFLRRGLDLLAPRGLGVFLVPAGFLTGQATRNLKLRETILRRHHLSAAFRLPSELFPGVNLVTDLLFFRARGVILDEVPEDDAFVVGGGYFLRYPHHILGREVGTDAGDDQPGRAWRYAVEGTFTALPFFNERPICSACAIDPSAEPEDDAPSPILGTSGVVRQVRDEADGLSDRHALAVSLGLRVDRYLTALAAEHSDEAPQLWGELHHALTSWRARYGSPWMDTVLVGLARPPRSLTGAERFLSAFTKLGELIPGLQQKPSVTRRYTGRRDDVLALAEWLFQSRRALTLPELEGAWREHNMVPFSSRNAVQQLVGAGWFWDRDPATGTGPLLPRDHYLSGHLWPRYDRAKALAGKADPIATAHARELLGAIRPSTYDEIDTLSPRQGWIPLDIVQGWINTRLQRKDGRLPDVTLERVNGLTSLVKREYSDLDGQLPGVAPETLSCLGWINHDRSLFKPKKQKQSDDIDEVRLKQAEAWESDFRVWLGGDEVLRARVEETYNRLFRGYITPTYSSEPLPIARWAAKGPRLHAHQVAGARRILSNKGGLVAFDVGVGKTYTGIAILAHARQEGWVKRPVVVVPNSIIWKWEADIKRVLPDYRIAVIGSKRKVISRGPRKGLLTSETDTPVERASKWTRFQAGEFDVVLLSYTALGRTRMNEAVLRAYADRTEAIQREIILKQRNAEDKEDLTERESAILKEGTAAWIAEKMELPKKWEYDPGVAWDDIGVDLLIVDEAQNYKNLFKPAKREGGVPRFMGTAGEGSDRAWQLDFRAEAVRRRTGGVGIVLLSATPAKNSPLEFYNLIQYIDHDAWSRMGITDPEQFIDRYLKIELKDVIDTKLDVVKRSAVVGFQNLHELRDVLFRYCEFKTAEEVGLKLPTPRVNPPVQVQMDKVQEDKYAHYVAEIEAILEGRTRASKNRVLGLLSRLALVSIHPLLDEGYDWKKAAKPEINPHSPKLDACAARVKQIPSCGHIIFADNLAIHQWMRRVLIEVGIPAERIGVLNSETAESSADRQRIAEEFNGNPDEGIEPKYDVVIANAIAYEGIDLQTRTCAIHHLDLPWEPATLQQRNGRGVRQGNRLATIEINYYFALRSSDGLRFNLIDGKRGWMVELLQSQARETNNPGAQMEMTPEEMLLLISRNPEETAKRLAGVRAARELAAKEKKANEAARLLRAANTLFRRAELRPDPEDAARLRREGEERLKALSTVDPEAWPWGAVAGAVREHNMLVPDKGACPIYEGMVLRLPSRYAASGMDTVQIGRIDGARYGRRDAGALFWTTPDSLDALRDLKPDQILPSMPTSDEPALIGGASEAIARRLTSASAVRALGWEWASENWLLRAWSWFGVQVRAGLVSLVNRASYLRERLLFPVVDNRGLRLLAGRELAADTGELLMPGGEGWRRYLELAPDSGRSTKDLTEVARQWFDRDLPKAQPRAEAPDQRSVA